MSSLATAPFRAKDLLEGAFTSFATPKKRTEREPSSARSAFDCTRGLKNMIAPFYSRPSECSPSPMPVPILSGLEERAGERRPFCAWSFSGIWSLEFGVWNFPRHLTPDTRHSAPVHPIRRAIIDVGTNSIKLLVADVHGHEVVPVSEESKQTRLGSGFYESHRLQSGAIKSTANVVATFAQAARDLKASSIRVLGTSAAREATNASELISAIHTASGLDVEIISGEQEADLVFQGVTTDPALAAMPLLLLDVGGGSTEFILGQGDQKHFRASFPLGTVRLLEKLPPSDPPRAEELRACRQWLKDFLEKEVRPRLDPAMRQEVQSNPKHAPIQLVATGGPATILARIE